MRKLIAVLLACTWIGALPLLAATDSASNPKDELALTALEGLMSAPAERALPLLRKVLSGNRSDLIKRRALFVLSQIEQPEAQQLLLEHARGANPALSHEAIRAVGIGGDSDSLGELSTIYRDGDSEVRDAVLEAWMISDREEEIFQVALAATSEAEADKAIHLLGAMDARQSLRRLGEAGKGSASLMQAYAISGDLPALTQIVRESDDQSLRIAAIQGIGIIDGDEARQALQQIYGQAENEEVREAALHGMLIADDEQGVLGLYQASSDPVRKQELLRTLTMIGGDAALEAIDAALEGRQP